MQWLLECRTRRQRIRAISDPSGYHLTRAGGRRQRCNGRRVDHGAAAGPNYFGIEQFLVSEVVPTIRRGA